MSPNEFLTEEATKIASIFQVSTSNNKNFSIATILIIVETLVTLAKACGYINRTPEQIAAIAQSPSRLQRLIVRGHVFAAVLKKGGWRTEDVGALVDAIFERGKTASVDEITKLKVAALTYVEK